jgi:hypothetical protein
MFDWQQNLVEVRFPDEIDNFLKVKETLTRIGAPAHGENNERILWQSCHILHKQQRYFVVHFKELFLLDGKETQTILTVNDLARRNAIVRLLVEWKLVEVVNPTQILTPAPIPVDSLKIIPFKEKGNWYLQAKYEIGKKRGDKYEY